MPEFGGITGLQERTIPRKPGDSGLRQISTWYGTDRKPRFERIESLGSNGPKAPVRSAPHLKGNAFGCQVMCSKTYFFQ